MQCDGNGTDTTTSTGMFKKQTTKALCDTIENYEELKDAFLNKSTEERFQVASY
jgi:endo-beta-N-acetylglucosaminidase D